VRDGAEEDGASASTRLPARRQEVRDACEIGTPGRTELVDERLDLRVAKHVRQQAFVVLVVGVERRERCLEPVLGIRYAGP